MRCGGAFYKPDFMMKINTFLEQLSAHISNPLSNTISEHLQAINDFNQHNESNEIFGQKCKFQQKWSGKNYATS